MNKQEKEVVNSPIINMMRETVVEGFTPTFCSYCGAGHHELTIEILRGAEEDTTTLGITYVEYDVEYLVLCDVCGKSFSVQPYETKGLIKEIK